MKMYNTRDHHTHYHNTTTPDTNNTDRPSSFSLSFLSFLCPCGVLGEGERDRVCTFKTPSVCTFKTSPCVLAPRPHVVTHAGVVRVHSGTF